ncbi:MAG: cytochrome c [Chitinophagales bacterium]|nr:cytochrome c [Chitinophagales bacterium]
MNKFLAFVTTLCMAASCSKKIVSPTAVTELQNPSNALSLYNNFCVRCHGDGGYSGKAPNLAKFAGDKNDAVQIIQSGEGRMPAFKDRLTRIEIDALADYVLSLK